MPIVAVPDDPGLRGVTGVTPEPSPAAAAEAIGQLSLP